MFAIISKFQTDHPHLLSEAGMDCIEEQVTSPDGSTGKQGIKSCVVDRMHRAIDCRTACLQVCLNYFRLKELPTMTKAYPSAKNTSEFRWLCVWEFPHLTSFAICQVKSLPAISTRDLKFIPSELYDSVYAKRVPAKWETSGNLDCIPCIQTNVFIAGLAAISMSPIFPLFPSTLVPFSLIWNHICLVFLINFVVNWPSILMSPSSTFLANICIYRSATCELIGKILMHKNTWLLLFVIAH